MNPDSHSAYPEQRQRRQSPPTGASQRRRPAGQGGGSYQPRYDRPTSGRNGVPPRRRRRRRSRRPQYLFVVGVCSLILLILSLVLLIHSCATRNPLVGKWKVDSMTSYVFYEGNSGALVVPRGRYTFTYTMDGDQLTIDFHDENALDSKYTFDKDGDQLTLVGGNAGARGTYVLQRVNK